jgi:hypothetical protein
MNAGTAVNAAPKSVMMTATMMRDVSGSMTNGPSGPVSSMGQALLFKAK